MDVIKSLMLVVSIVLLVLCVVLIIKCVVTFRNYIIITEAIYGYQIHTIGLDSLEVDYDDCESFVLTLFKLWDWGYKHILPHEKFALIEKYINKTED